MDHLIACFHLSCRKIFLLSRSFACQPELGLLGKPPGSKKSKKKQQEKTKATKTPSIRRGRASGLHLPHAGLLPQPPGPARGGAARSGASRSGRRSRRTAGALTREHAQGTTLEIGWHMVGGQKLYIYIYVYHIGKVPQHARVSATFSWPPSLCVGFDVSGKQVKMLREVVRVYSKYNHGSRRRRW